MNLYADYKSGDGVYGGVPAKLIKMRFSDDELAEHLELLKIHRTSNI